ncbi:MAG: AMP-binding protein, partial [Actinomycetota bacterium]
RDERRTWAELRGTVAQVCGRVSERTDPGDVVVVIGNTSIEFVEVMLGALAAGATVLPLNPRHPAAELEHACAMASPRMIVSVGADEQVSGLGEVVGAHDLRTGEPGEQVPVDEHDPGLLIFTSGTAGTPRLAMLSRANLSAAIRSTIVSSERLVEIATVVAGVMPLSHVLGLVSVLGVSLAAGATLVLLPDTEVDDVVAAIESNQVRLLVAPPVFWYRLAEAEPDRARMESVVLGVSGAAPLSGGLANRVEAALGISLRQGYGLTEASPGLTSSVGTDAPATSVGRPLPGVELRLIDEFGDDALVGDVGELLARGPNIFLGYLGDPEATASVFHDGWLRTGDLAVVDERGHLFIVGRSKDQIITSGFNVHPGEVEDWLTAHPSVEAAAVVGEPDREFGEVVVAHVVAQAGEEPSVEELVAHCRTRLAGYKVPNRIEFVDEIPRGLGGKVHRRVLRT